MNFTPYGTGPNTPWLPSDNGLLAAAGDPLDATAANALIAGSQYLFRITVRVPTLISSLWFLPSVAGVGASTGTFAGLLSPAGALLTTSADCAAALSATAPAQVAMGTPQLAQPGAPLIGALVVNQATSQVNLRCGVGATGGPVNVGLTAANARYAINGTGLAAITAFAPGANNVAVFCPWWGAS